jgi:hypothetical protein
MRHTIVIEVTGDASAPVAEHVVTQHVNNVGAYNTAGVRARVVEYHQPKPKDGEERQEPWGSGMAGSTLQMITLRYSAEDDEWLAVGEARQSAWDGNTAVRYDLKTSKPDGHGDVPICDALGGHVGWVSWEAWSSWPVIETEGEST